jgi:hypothetical protein
MRIYLLYQVKFCGQQYCTVALERKPGPVRGQPQFVRQDGTFMLVVRNVAIHSDK